MLVIGFDPVVYSANVNGDSVAITVKVLQGSLALPVSIRVFTENGTATCKWPRPHSMTQCEPLYSSWLRLRGYKPICGI